MTINEKPATPTTSAANNAVLSELPFHDRQSYEDVRRGFIATLDPMVITNESGRVVWDLERFKFLDSDAPDTVNPSLWRMSQLHMEHGLFRVADRIYQIRGFDISNMTVIEGDRGFIVIDPLTSTECAAAGMQVVREHLGDKPVTAVIYTHSHADHFGGVKGIVSEDDVRNGSVRIVAPMGFMEHTVSENVYAGNAMTRRCQYMHGNALPKGGRGMVSSGLGIAVSEGAVTLLSPTDIISESGQELTLDGVRIEFQYTPDSEAPAEMHFYLPDLRALCMAENVNHHMHNLYTLRGAEIRDAAAWSRYIHEALQRYGDRSDVMFISHQWPVWGQTQIREFLVKQRDLYRYIHDETLRLAAHGHTMVEIAEMIELPDSLAQCWSARGYYGTLSHNVKAVYQKYLGWFDANPANLHPHTPVESSKRYVEFMGGSESVLRKARRSFDAGDYRWVAQVVNHVVFSEPDNWQARELQADTLEQLGYQAESACWRNFYLTGARDLRAATVEDEPSLTTSEVISAMTTEMMLDYLAIKLNGPKAGRSEFSVLLHVTDTDERWLLQVTNGVLLATRAHDAGSFAVSVELTKAVLADLVLSDSCLDAAITSGSLRLDGDETDLRELFSLVDTFERSFAIVTP